MLKQNYSFCENLEICIHFSQIFNVYHQINPYLINRNVSIYAKYYNEFNSFKITFNSFRILMYNILMGISEVKHGRY